MPNCIQSRTKSFSSSTRIKKRRAYRSRKVCSSFSSHLNEVRPMKLPASFEKPARKLSEYQGPKMKQFIYNQNPLVFYCFKSVIISIPLLLSCVFSSWTSYVSSLALHTLLHTAVVLSFVSLLFVSVLVI